MQSNSMIVIDSDDSPTQPFLGEDTDENTLKRPSKRSWLSTLISATTTTSRPSWSWRTPPSTTSNPRTKRGILGRIYRYPPPELEAGRKETAWLDGMRGIAAFLVMIFHYDGGTLGIIHEAPYRAWYIEPVFFQGKRNKPAYQIQRLPVIRVIFATGHFQVCIFFILSGFVLAWSPLKAMRGSRRGVRIGGDEQQQPIELGRFAESLGSLAFRRWFRLFLPCFTVGIFSMLGQYFGLLHMLVPTYDNIFLQVWDYMQACQSFANPFRLFYDGSVQPTHRYNMVMWTIPLEWAGSLLVFITLLSIARIRSFRIRACIVSFIAIYACCSVLWHYWLFATGMLLADCVQQLNGFDNITVSTPLSRVFWILVLLVGLFLGGIPQVSEFYGRNGYEWIDNMTPTSYKDVEHGVRFWWSLGSIFTVTGAAHFKFIRQLLESNIARYLGRISFMLYLSHNVWGEAFGTPLLNFTKNVLGKSVHSELLGQDLIVVEGVFLTLVMYVSNVLILGSVALLIGSWLEVLVDTPCTQFARWLDRKIT